MKTILIIGIYVLICALVVFYQWNNLRKTAFCEASVKSKSVKNTAQGRLNFKTDNIEFSYFVNGKEYLMEVDDYAINNQKTEIIYQKNNPQNAWVNTFLGKWTTTLISLLFATIFCLASLFFIK